MAYPLGERAPAEAPTRHARASGLRDVYARFMACPAVARWLLAREPLADFVNVTPERCVLVNVASAPAAEMEPMPLTPGTQAVADVHDLLFVELVAEEYGLGYVLGDPSSDTHPLSHLPAQISVPGWHKLRCRRFAIAHRPWNSLTRVEFAWFDDQSVIVTITETPSRPCAQLHALQETYFFPYVSPHAAPSGAPLVTAFTTDVPACALCRHSPRLACPCPRAPEPAPPPPSATAWHLPLSRRFLGALAQCNASGKLTTTLTVPGTHGEPLVRAKIARAYSLAFGDPHAVSNAIHLRLKELLLPRPPPMPPPMRAPPASAWARTSADLDGYLASFGEPAPDRRLHAPSVDAVAVAPADTTDFSCSPVTQTAPVWSSEPLSVSRLRHYSLPEAPLAFAPPPKRRRLPTAAGADALPSPFMSTILNNVSKGEVPLTSFGGPTGAGGFLQPATDAPADRKPGNCPLPSPLSMILDFNDDALRKRARTEATREDILPLAFEAAWEAVVADDADPLRRFRAPLAWPAPTGERSAPPLARALGGERPADERGRWQQAGLGGRRFEVPLLASGGFDGRNGRGGLLPGAGGLLPPPPPPPPPVRTRTASSSVGTADRPSAGGRRAGAATCDICHASFSKRANLVRHTKTVHNNVKPFECKTCRSRFGLKADLHRHVRNIHEKRAFCCRACGRSFAEQEELDFHYRVTHEKDMRPFECGQCGMRFGRRSSRRRHEQTVHSQRRFECTVCDKSYSQRFDAIKHGRKAHGIENMVT